MELEKICEYVKSNISGWCGGGGAPIPDVIRMMLAMKRNVQEGDHLEIGTLWGSTAIAAALAKDELGQAGMIYCVDPFEYDRQEPCSRKAGNITQARSEAMPEIFMENVKRFGVEHRIVLIQKTSDEAKKELKGKRFMSALLDGYPYGDQPLKDAKFAMSVCDGWIAQDDVVRYYPGKMKAFLWLASSKDWNFHSMFNRTALFFKHRYSQNMYSEFVSGPIPFEVMRLPENLA